MFMRNLLIIRMLCKFDVPVKDSVNILFFKKMIFHLFQKQLKGGGAGCMGINLIEL